MRDGDRSIWTATSIARIRWPRPLKIVPNLGYLGLCCRELRNVGTLSKPEDGSSDMVTAEMADLWLVDVVILNL